MLLACFRPALSVLSTMSTPCKRHALCMILWLQQGSIKQKRLIYGGLYFAGACYKPTIGAPCGCFKRRPEHETSIPKISKSWMPARPDSLLDKSVAHPVGTPAALTAIYIIKHDMSMIQLGNGAAACRETYSQDIAIASCKCIQDIAIASCKCMPLVSVRTRSEIDLIIFL